MKKQYIVSFSLVILFMLSTVSLKAADLKLLRIEESGDREKLFFNIEDIEKIVGGFDVGNMLVFIEFADAKDKVLARIGKLKKGEISWTHKQESKTKLLVKFSKEDFPGIQEKIRQNLMRPGFQVILSDSKTNEVLKSYEITTRAFPNLSIEISYPINVGPGDDLQETLKAAVKNTGSAGAGDFRVDFKLTAEGQPDIALGSISPPTGAGQLMPDGILTMSPGAPIKVPGDIQPGRFQMVARVDAAGVIEELDETDNEFQGLIIISAPEPSALVLELTDTSLVFDPANWDFTIRHGSTVLSDGKDWRKCRIKPNVYQLRHASWPDFHWEIDTYDRSVWRVTGADFCKTGGKAKEVIIKVLVVGGSKTEVPKKVELKLEKTILEFKPSTRQFNITSFGEQIAYIPFWQTCKLESHLYQFKNSQWTDHYWQVDTFKKTVHEITGGQFCRLGTGADSTELNIPLKVGK